MKRRGRRVLCAAIPLGFLGVFFVWPVAAIIGRSVTAGALHHVLTDRGLRHVAWFTLWQALVATALTLAVGLPAAYVVARYEFPGRRLFRAFVTVPFVLPTVVVATAFLVLFRPGGALSFLGWQRGVAAAGRGGVLQRRGGRAHGRRVLVESRSAPHRRGACSARRGGARSARSRCRCSARRSRPRRRSCSCSRSRRSAWCCCSPTPHATLEVEIYRQAVQLFDLPIAAALALVQMVAVVSLLLVLARMQERRAVAQRLVAARDAARRPRGSERWVVAGVLGVTTLFLGGPLLVLAIESLRLGGSWSLAPYRALSSSSATDTLFVPPWEALRNSLEFAALAAADRGGGRRARVGGDRVAAGTRDARDGHAVDAAARHVGGHHRLRVPRGARPVAARPAAKVVLVPDRAGGGRDPVRHPRRGARAAIDRPAPARRGPRCSARRRARVARGRPADRDAGVHRRLRVRDRGVARRVRRDAVRRPARLADDPDRDLALPRPAGRAERRPGDGDVDDPHARDGLVVLAIEQVHVRQLGEL